MKKYTVEDGKTKSPQYDSFFDTRRETERMLEWGATEVILKVFDVPVKMYIIKTEKDTFEWTESSEAVAIARAGNLVHNGIPFTFSTTEQ